MFAAEKPNELWLVDITEHKTAEGKLCCCAIKDAFSGRIVGYSVDSLRALARHCMVGSMGRVGLAA